MGTPNERTAMTIAPDLPDIEELDWPTPEPETVIEPEEPQPQEDVKETSVFDHYADHYEDHRGRRHYCYCSPTRGMFFDRYREGQRAWEEMPAMTAHTWIPEAESQEVRREMAMALQRDRAAYNARMAPAQPDWSLYKPPGVHCDGSQGGPRLIGDYGIVNAGSGG